MDKKEALEVMLKWASDNPYDSVPEIQEAYEVLKHATRDTILNDKQKIINLINEERIAQDKKWGVQRHHPFMWNTILGEEVGEVNQASLDLENGIDTEEHLVEELIQVAAVAVSYVESIWANRKSKDK